MSQIKKILLCRDNLTSIEADYLITEATESLHNYLASGDTMAAYDICAEYFGLEPDYIDELI